jgi:hypothetical protein
MAANTHSSKIHLRSFISDGAMTVVFYQNGLPSERTQTGFKPRPQQPVCLQTCFAQQLDLKRCLGFGMAEGI